jgi:hypothetical protein
VLTAAPTVAEYFPAPQTVHVALEMAPVAAEYVMAEQDARVGSGRCGARVRPCRAEAA